MLATLLATSLSSLDSCSACSTEGRFVKLCEPHAVEEKAVLARENRNLAAKDPAVRMAALDAVAALTTDHTNAPSARVVERIASALDDEDFGVRTHATGLLGRPQHALESLETLVKALAGTAKEQASLNSDHDALSHKLEGKLSDKRRSDVVAEREACEARRKALGRWRLELVNRLASFPDDRAVDAILAHTHRNLLTGGDEALVRLGNRDAVRALAESFAGCDRNLAMVEEEAAAWKARSTPGTQTAGEALAMYALERLRAESARMRQDLATLFAERGLTAPGLASTADWRTWIEQNIEAFPVHLPGVSSPAW